MFLYKMHSLHYVVINMKENKVIKYFTITQFKILARLILFALGYGLVMGFVMQDGKEQFFLDGAYPFAALFTFMIGFVIVSNISLTRVPTALSMSMIRSHVIKGFQVVVAEAFIEQTILLGALFYGYISYKNISVSIPVVLVSSAIASLCSISIGLVTAVLADQSNPLAKFARVFTTLFGVAAGVLCALIVNNQLSEIFPAAVMDKLVWIAAVLGVIVVVSTIMLVRSMNKRILNLSLS